MGGEWEYFLFSKNYLTFKYNYDNDFVDTEYSVLPSTYLYKEIYLLNYEELKNEEDPEPPPAVDTHYLFPPSIVVIYYHLPPTVYSPSIPMPHTSSHIIWIVYKHILTSQCFISLGWF